MATTINANRWAEGAQPFPGWKWAAQKGNDRTEIGSAILAEAQIICQWLNRARGTSSYERVTCLLTTFEDVRTLIETYWTLQDYVLPKAADWKKRLRENAEAHASETEQAIDELNIAINKQLSTYTFRPRLNYNLSNRTWDAGILPDEHPDWFEVIINSRTVSEADVVLSIVRLEKSNMLKILRLCSYCKQNWRTSPKKHYRFCSARCRESFFAHETRSRAEIQRRYRARIKRRDKANLALTLQPDPLRHDSKAFHRQ